MPAEYPATQLPPGGLIGTAAPGTCRQLLQALPPHSLQKAIQSVRELQKLGLGGLAANDLSQQLAALPPDIVQPPRRPMAPKLLWRDGRLCREEQSHVPQELCRVLTPSSPRVAVRASDLGELTRSKEAADLLLGTCLELASQGTANIGDLIRSVIQGASKLMMADRCSLFRVDGDNLVSSIPGEEGPKTIRVRVGSGIAGFVAQSGQMLNIPDAYSDSRFNQEVDKQTGYQTKSLLCGPVFFQGSVIAVVQLVNKVVAGACVPFTTDDEALFRGFASFAGVALSNAYLYHDTLAERRKNDVLIESVRTLSSADVRNADDVSSAIRGAVTELLNAELCTFFAVEKESGCLVAHTEKGERISTSLGQGIAGRVWQTKETVNINDPYADPLFNPDIDEKVGTVTRDILCMPIVRPAGKNEVMGVVQVLNKIGQAGFTTEDEEHLEFFAQFMALQLSHAAMCEEILESKEEALRLLALESGLVSAGNPSRSGIFPASDTAVSVAMAVDLTAEEKSLVMTSDFNVHNYSEASTQDRLAPLGVFMMEQMGFLDTYGIPAAKLCKFLLTVSSKYRAVPYHNFKHAFDVSQTLAVFLRVGKAIDALSDLDAFALLISAFLHDIDHMGLNNSFHTKTETPLGFLHSESGASSVMEVHHCNLSLEVLGMEPTGVFDTMSKADSQYAYKSLIGNILATDMAKHKQLMEMFGAMQQSGYDRDNADHRRLSTKLLMKSADLSNLSKPFNIARLWAIAVTNEFFEQGDMEKVIGCGVTPMFNRESNKELASSQIGFIDFVAMPFYTVLANAFPDLSFALKQLEANRDRWSQVSEARRKSQDDAQQEVAGSRTRKIF